MATLLEKSTNFNRKIKINFDGGDLTSDADLLLYKEFDEKIGFSGTIKAAKIVNSSRYLTFKLCSSCPYKTEFWDTLNRINNLSISP